MFRIMHYPAGFVVEIHKTKWYGGKYWTHYISVTGLPTHPWYYTSFEFALQGLQSEIKYEIFRNVRKYNH
jgi:hypothetical protein